MRSLISTTSITSSSSLSSQHSLLMCNPGRFSLFVCCSNLLSYEGYVWCELLQALTCYCFNDSRGCATLVPFWFTSIQLGLPLHQFPIELIITSGCARPRLFHAIGILLFQGQHGISRTSSPLSSMLILRKQRFIKCSPLLWWPIKHNLSLSINLLHRPIVWSSVRSQFTPVITIRYLLVNMTIPSAQQLAPTVTEITRSCAWDSLRNIMDPYSLIGITSGLYQLLWTAHDSRLLWLGSNEGPSPLVIVTDTSSWVISHFKLPWWIPITCGAWLWTMGDYHSLAWTISNYYTLIWTTSGYYDLWLGIDSILDLLWLTTSNLYLVWWSSNNSCSLSWPSRVLYLMRSTTGASYSLLGIPYFTTRFLSVFHYILSVPPYIELMERLASSIESTILLRLLLVSDLERDDLSNFIKSYRSRFSLRRPQDLNNPESFAHESGDLLFLKCEPRCPGDLALSPVVPKVAVLLSVVLQVATSTPVDPRIATIQPVSPRDSAFQPFSPRISTPQHVVHKVAAPPQPCYPCEPDSLATVCYSRRF